MDEEEGFAALKAKWGGKGEPAPQANPAPQPKADPIPQSKMGFIEKIKKVLMSPSEFFDRIKDEQGIGGAFAYLAVLSLIGLVANIALFQLEFSALSTLSKLIPFGSMLAIGTFLSILISLAMYAGSLLLPFISAGFIHLFSRMLGGKGDYSATYKAMIYGSTPSLLFGWIPYVGLLAVLYNIYLSTLGISKLHNLSMGRAFVAVFVIPFVIGIIITAALVGVALFYAMGMFKLTSAPVACSPCFSSFAYVDYSSGTLTIRSGSREITNLKLISLPEGGLTTSWTSSETIPPGTILTISGFQAGMTYMPILNYTDVDSGLTHTDSAALHA